MTEPGPGRKGDRTDVAPLRRRAGEGTVCAVAVLASAVVLSPELSAQQLQPPPAPADSGTEVAVVPGAQYAAGWLRRLVLGANHRDLWTREVTVPILDLDRFGGGLTAEDQGGNQSKTLHLRADRGPTYIFRSVDKYLGQVLPEDLRGTLLHDLGQDQISVFHPAGAFVVPPLHTALGQLPVPPVYRVMPDDPRLGQYRETFAGMLGTVVERPDEGTGGSPGFAGSHRVVSTEELLDKLEDHPRNQPASREFLGARLVDFLVGDTDRGPDQWRWARVAEPWGFRWRPVVRDRDWAFMHADGALARMVGLAFPKLVVFGDELPAVGRMTWGDLGMGRRLLAGLDRAAFRSTAEEVVRTLDDEVIDRAVAHLPPEYRGDHARLLADRLKRRRSGLVAAGLSWYERLSTDVDIRGTDFPDRAEVTRRGDGTLEVTLYAPVGAMVPVVSGAGDDAEAARERAADPYYDRGHEWDGRVDGWRPYYRRTFDPAETREVRIHLHGGADTAVVRGEGAPDITVRLLGGGGDDVLHDEAETSDRTVLYDDDGAVFVPGPRTRVDRRPFDEPEGTERFQVQRLGYDRHRDWGSEVSWFDLALDYREGAGVIVGGGPSWIDYRFRTVPHGARVAVAGLVATRTGGLGLDGVAEVRPENAPTVFRLHARATQFEAVRFYGYGNDAPLLDTGTALVMQDRALVEATAGIETDRWRASAGPLVRYTDPRVPAGNPAADADLPGADAMFEAGLRATASFDGAGPGVPTRGVRVRMQADVLPVAGGAGAWGRAEAEARGYLELPLPGRPVAAVRVGARAAEGDAPIHGAARIGGSGTLRGYRWQRFAGDRAVYGGVDLRVPLARVNLYLVKGRLGVLGLADAGRVWIEGESPGDWHTSQGAGVYLETLGSALHAQWARGEEDRIYVGLGVPF